MRGLCAAFAGTTAYEVLGSAIFAPCRGPRAHISQVCTVTHPDNLGVVTFFLGTYHHGNSMTQNVAGEVYITPPSGLTRQPGSPRCARSVTSLTNDGPGQAELSDVYNTYYFMRDEHRVQELNDKNGNLIKTDSTAACYKGTRTRPRTTGPFRCTAATRTSIDLPRRNKPTGWSHQCTTRSRNV